MGEGPGGGFNVFASKDKCPKCGKQKPDESNGAGLDGIRAREDRRDVGSRELLLKPRRRDRSSSSEDSGWGKTAAAQAETRRAQERERGMERQPPKLTKREPSKERRMERQPPKLTKREPSEERSIE